MIPDPDEIQVLTNVKEQNSEQIKNLEQRIQSLEKEQSSLKATISVNEESRTKNSSNIESISEKVIILSNDMKKLKEIGSEEASNMRETTSYKCKKRDEAYNEKGRLSQHVKNQHIKTSLKCDLCDQSFFENFQLEDHLLKDHQQMKNFTCKECNLSYVLKWRLDKHLEGHSPRVQLRACHFYNNGKSCPFEKIGCKFLHQEAGICKYKNKCRRPMCQFRHC